MRRRGLPLAIALSVLALTGLIFAMLEFPDELIFPVRSVPPAGPLPAGAEVLTVQAGSGEELRGVRISPSKRQAETVLVLGFGGNAWNGQDVAEYLHELYPDAEVVAFHYRGYRPSSGVPSAKALIADAPLVYDDAVARIRPDRSIAVGFSIGTGVAASLASARKLDGLILVTPFDSLKAVAQSMIPWLPLGPLFPHEIDAARALRAVDTPVAVLSAERDEIIPGKRTDALRKAVRNLVFDRTIIGAGHNDIYVRDDFRRAMDEALAALARPCRKSRSHPYSSGK